MMGEKVQRNTTTAEETPITMEEALHKIYLFNESHQDNNNKQAKKRRKRSLEWLLPVLDLIAYLIIISFVAALLGAVVIFTKNQIWQMPLTTSAEVVCFTLLTLLGSFVFLYFGVDYLNESIKEKELEEMRFGKYISRNISLCGLGILVIEAAVFLLLKFL